jgi:transposase
MPAIPPFIREPLWDQFAALLPQPQATHPLGCHRPRIPDQAVFDKLLQVPVFGCGYRRIADATCSATIIPPPPRRMGRRPAHAAPGTDRA